MSKLKDSLKAQKFEFHKSEKSIVFYLKEKNLIFSSELLAKQNFLETANVHFCCLSKRLQNILFKTIPLSKCLLQANTTENKTFVQS